MIIFDGQTAITGMRVGIDLCLRTLVPSLFPFFVLTPLVTFTLMGMPIKSGKFLSKFCRIPAGSESLLVVGLLGGYPLGAGNIASELQRGTLSKSDAERMAIFCNNAGPSFLFGILSTMFPRLYWVWLLWFIQIAASLLTGFLLPGGSSKAALCCQQNPVTLSESLRQAVRNIAMVCGWVVIFRVILTFLQVYVLNFIPNTLCVMMTGLLELSNGCITLSRIENEIQRFIFAGILLSLGGVCIWMQTQAVFPELNLSRYIAGRCLHCLICICLSLLAVPVLSNNFSFYGFIILLFAGLGIIILLHFLRKSKKEVAFYHSMMYNG